jgi:peptidyl-prolyl cis-trans isomerase SurA
VGVLIAGLATSPGILSAQEAQPVDRIAAVVGDSVITFTQLQERILQLQYQGVQIPPQGEALSRLQRDLLDQMVGELLIVQAALRDTTITVDEAELEETVNQEIQDRSRGYATQAAFQQALASQGWSLTSYREYLRAQARQQRLYSVYMSKRAPELSRIVVESTEIAAFFEAQKAAIGQRPPSVTFKQVVVAPSPSDSSLQAARAQADSIRQLGVAGEDFEELARRFSQDPGSRANGGDLGWFRRGDMEPAFEEAAFNLIPGAVSEPVRTPYGFHIIKVDRRRAGEVRARHILIPVPPSPADQELARGKAAQVRGRLEAGAPIEELIAEYADPEEPDSLDVAFDRLRELPPGFAEPLTQAETGQIIGPLEYQVREGQYRFAVLKVLVVQEGRPWTIEDADLRDQIRQRLQQGKLQERVLQELRAKTFVEIRL